MTVRLDLNGYSNTVEREVKGAFGSFFVTIRQPSSLDRMAARAYQANKDFEELYKLRLSLVTGWRELDDAEGKPIPFNHQTLEIVLRIQPIQDAINWVVREYMEESTAILSDDVKKKSEEQPRNTEAKEVAIP